MATTTRRGSTYDTGFPAGNGGATVTGRAGGVFTAVVDVADGVAESEGVALDAATDVVAVDAPDVAEAADDDAAAGLGDVAAELPEPTAEDAGGDAVTGAATTAVASAGATTVVAGFVAGVAAGTSTDGTDVAAVDGVIAETGGAVTAGAALSPAASSTDAAGVRSYKSTTSRCPYNSFGGSVKLFTRTSTARSSTTRVVPSACNPLRTRRTGDSARSTVSSFAFSAASRKSITTRPGATFDNTWYFGGSETSNTKRVYSGAR